MVAVLDNLATRGSPRIAPLETGTEAGRAFVPFARGALLFGTRPMMTVALCEQRSPWWAPKACEITQWLARVDNERIAH